MDLSTKIRCLFSDMGWTINEYALAWIYIELKNGGGKTIQVAKDLSRVDLLAPENKKLFTREISGRYVVEEESLGKVVVRSDEMFRLLRKIVCP